jgi:hypothetical protein
MESPFMTSRPRWSRRRAATRLFLGAVAGLGLTATPAVALDAPSVLPTVYASTELSGPTITSFSAVPGPGGSVTFSGTVTDDESVEGCVVVIEGPGVYAVAVVDNGAFSTTVTVFGQGPITVTATVTDADGNTDEASTTFTPTPAGGGGGGRIHTGTGTPPPPPPGGPM